jgi:hypothetical protein
MILHDSVNDPCYLTYDMEVLSQHKNQLSNPRLACQ